MYLTVFQSYHKGSHIPSSWIHGSTTSPSKCFLGLDPLGFLTARVLDLDTLALAVVPEEVVQPHHEGHDHQGEQGHELHDVLKAATLDGNK